jgi:hypothetical protein
MIPQVFISFTNWVLINFLCCQLLMVKALFIQESEVVSRTTWFQFNGNFMFV